MFAELELLLRDWYPSILQDSFLDRSITTQRPKPSKYDIKNPKELVFLKDEEYSYQREYRLVFGRKNAFKLEQKIVVNSAYDFLSAAKNRIPKEKRIMIGPIRELVTVHRR